VEHQIRRICAPYAKIGHPRIKWICHFPRPSIRRKRAAQVNADRDLGKAIKLDHTPTVYIVSSRNPSRPYVKSGQQPALLHHRCGDERVSFRPFYFANLRTLKENRQADDDHVHQQPQNQIM